MSLIYARLPDGSTNPAWLEARRGKITASEIHRVVGTPLVRGTYLMKLLTERITGKLLDHGGVSTAMQQGIDREEEAGERYAEETGAMLVPGYWVWDAEHSYGGTPDFLVDGGGGVEVKCPQPKGAIIARFHEHLGGKWRDRDAYEWQCRACAALTEEPWWDLAIYSPELKDLDLDLTVKRVYRDYDLEAKMLDAVFEAERMLVAAFDEAMHTKRLWVERTVIPMIREAQSHEAVQEAENEVYKLGPGVLPKALVKAIEAAVRAKTLTLPSPIGA